jgi:type I restriction enzyme R subunit
MGYIRQGPWAVRWCPTSSGWRRPCKKILASRSWTTPQRQWLQRIANQTKAIPIVDREALDDDLLFFKREGGGWPRLNRVFGGELDGVLQQFQREVWAA